MLKINKTTKFTWMLCATIILSACGDPYAKKINNKLTPSEAEKIAKSLPNSDGDLFLRWSQRNSLGERFGGEGTVYTVRDAINTQTVYESRKAEEYEKEKEFKKKQESAREKELLALKEKNSQIEKVRHLRQLTDAEINKAIDKRAVNYRIEPQLDRFNREIGWQWVFNIEIKNKTEAPIIGLAGYITIKDVFGENLGTYPFSFESEINGGQSKILSLYMQDNPKDQNLRRLKSATKIFPEWFLESLAFSNGWRIDLESVEKSTRSSTEKST